MTELIIVNYRLEQNQYSNITFIVIVNIITIIY